MDTLVQRYTNYYECQNLSIKYYREICEIRRTKRKKKDFFFKFLKVLWGEFGGVYKKKYIYARNYAVKNIFTSGGSCIKIYYSFQKIEGEIFLKMLKR